MVITTTTNNYLGSELKKQDRVCCAVFLVSSAQKFAFLFVHVIYVILPNVSNLVLGIVLLVVAGLPTT